MSKPPTLLLALLALAPPFAAVQDAPPAGTGDDGRDAVAGASHGAREAWHTLVEAAAGKDGERSPIRAFTLRAEGRRRDSVQTNDFHFDYRYLAPDCIRFALPDGKETGRSGRKQRDYWVRTAEGLVPLVGAEYAEDRRVVREMHAIARNFVALSDPGSLDITRLELLPDPPADLEPGLRRRSRRMPWLRVVSPDFALFTDTVRDAGTGEAEPPRSFAVDLALRTEGPAAGLPRYAIIREEGPRPTAGPMLLGLDDYVDVNGFRIPHSIRVHGLDTGTGRFSEKPGQEVYVLEADLRPDLSVEDFQGEE